MYKPLTTGDVARILNVSESRVRQFEGAGVLSAVRIGKSNLRLFDGAQVEAVRQQREELHKKSGRRR